MKIKTREKYILILSYKEFIIIKDLLDAEQERTELSPEREKINDMLKLMIKKDPSYY